MDLQLTSQERTILQDQLKHEAICIQKYQKYASEAMDPELQQLFNSLVTKEQQHFATIQQMLDGAAPNLQQGQGQQGQQSQQSQQSQGQMSQGGQYQAQGATENAAEQSAETYLGHDVQSIQGSLGNLIEGDAALCTDSVMTEKFVSGSYDTGVFQSSNQQVIQALQHIQKEEQEHGQQLKQFMESKGLQ